MKFDGLRILVAGDVMLDHYITGAASRVSPEAPVPVINKKQAWTVPGGAANVARGLAALGCKPELLGLVGRDAAGETLIREMEALGVKGGMIRSNRPTTCKTRIMAQGQQLLRVDEEVIRGPSLEESVALKLHCDQLFAGCDAVIISDYAKGTLFRDRTGRSLAEYIIDKCERAGIPALVDPKGIDWSRYAGAQCVTPNHSEFAQIAQTLGGVHKESQAAREAEARNICRDFNIANMLLTRGAQGMTLYEKGERAVHIKAVQREVADVSGAGDTVIAVLTACRASGLPWLESAEIANVAAGVAVGKLGAAPVSIEELEEALHRAGANPRLYDWSSLAEKLRGWRKNGQKIVFTNGCFDLLHPGHISLIRQSAAMGDRLVVGLNSDASVRRLKGPERPIQSERNRALVLGAVKDVDAVIIFDEDTPEELIKKIRPDILVKGADYSIANIVGADFVQSYGGQVRLATLVDGASTTGIVRRMRRE